jgi:GT2 family glycosyltransferase
MAETIASQNDSELSSNDPENSPSCGSSNPYASVIIATLNRKRLLEQCLRSLLDQNYRNFEVIVVDGGSTDGTEELVKHFHSKFVRQSGKFQPSGENCGIKSARGEILAFLDDDVVVLGNWMESIVHGFHDASVDGVGGRIIQPDLGEAMLSDVGLNPYLKLRNRIFSVICENKLGETGLALRSGYVSGNFGRETPLCHDVHTFQGANMSFRRVLFEKIGLFDESYVPSPFRFETEFCLRALAHGFRLIYKPDAVVYHQAHDAHASRAEGHNFGRKLYYNSFNNTKFVMRARKQIPGFSWIRFILLQLFSAEECLRLAIRRRDLRYLLGPLGTLAAMRDWISNSNNIQVGKIPCVSPR